MDIDLNTFRSLVTVFSLLLFLGLMAWTMNRRRKAGFEEAAQLPFLDEPIQPNRANEERSKS